MQTRPQDHAAPTLLPRCLVGGAERPVSEWTERRNPADARDVVTRVPEAPADLVAEACVRAREAQVGWGEVPPPERAQVIRRLAGLLRQTKEQLARFICREVGKPLSEARGSVQEAIDTADYFQGEGRRLHGQTVPSELRHKDLWTYRRPVGVVAAITPGNFPLAVPSWKLVPAIVAGNAVVWKPSEDASGVAALFAELWQRAGLPPGVLSVLYGTGAGTGAHLVAQVAAGTVDKVSFTGSTEVGRAVAELCGRHLQVPSLELGGKNPLVILADADLDLAVTGAFWGAFATAGQRCTSVGNIVVDRRVLPVVRDRLVQRTRHARIGDPTDPRVDYGPLINDRFLDRWLRQRGEGIAEGAEPLLDGRRVTARTVPEGFAGDATHGRYVEPRLFQHVRPEMSIAREECFGPTVNLIEVDGLDEAIAAANATPYGLSAAIYTRDVRAMSEFRQRSRAGMVTLNGPTIGAEAHMPFGGNGWSGNGTREGGQWVLDAYTRWQAVSLDWSGQLQRAQIDVTDEQAVDAPDYAALVADHSATGDRPKER